MRIAVFGAGGAGGYFGGRLAQAGEEVIFIARGEHLRALQTEGLRVESVKGDFHLQPVQATDRPENVGEVDAILVGVKTWQLPEAARQMTPMVGAQTIVVPLENGIEAPGQIAAAVGAGHALGGVCQISAFIQAPGCIRHAGIEPFIAFGDLDRRPRPEVERLRQAFENAGVKVQVPPDIRISMWQKFAFIAAISGVGAVSHAPLGVMRSVPETRSLLAQAIQETVRVAQAYGVALPEDQASRTLQMIDGMDAGVTASMQRDIIAGRPSELEAQNGALVRLGASLGVPVPVHTYLYASLLPQEQRARGLLSF